MPLGGDAVRAATPTLACACRETAWRAKAACGRPPSADLAAKAPHKCARRELLVEGGWPIRRPSTSKRRQALLGGRGAGACWPPRPGREPSRRDRLSSAAMSLSASAGGCRAPELRFPAPGRARRARRLHCAVVSVRGQAICLESFFRAISCAHRDDGGTRRPARNRTVVGHEQPATTDGRDPSALRQRSPMPPRSGCASDAAPPRGRGGDLVGGRAPRGRGKRFGVRRRL